MRSNRAQHRTSSGANAAAVMAMTCSFWVLACGKTPGKPTPTHDSKGPQEAGESANKAKDTPPMPRNKVLQEWMSLREVAVDELKQQLNVAEEHIGRDRSFEKLQGVTQWYNPDAHPGYFIFQGDELAVIYVDDETAMTELSLAQMQRDLGPPEAELRSRAGKAVPLYVSASKGVAYAADDEGVYYVQIFAPTTAEDYQSRIYEEVGPYRK